MRNTLTLSIESRRWEARLTRAISLVVIVGSSACAFHHAEEPPAPIRSPTRDSLLIVDAARGEAATRQGFATAAGVWLDSSAVYLRAGAPIVYGRAAALSILADATAEHPAYQIRPLGGGVSRDGQGGYTFGVATTALPNADGPPTVRSDRYAAFWRRGGDGAWRIVAYAEIGGAPLASTIQVPSADLPPALVIPRGRRSDAVRQVRQADSAFALLADLQGTGIAFASYVAPQGVVFAGPEIVIGTEAVRALFDEQQRAGGTLNWRPVYADAVNSGDLGFSIGEYVFTGRGTNGTVVQRFGKYLTIWQQLPGGEWRFMVDGGNISPTPNR